MTRDKARSLRCSPVKRDNVFAVVWKTGAPFSLGFIETAGLRGVSLFNMDLSHCTWKCSLEDVSPVCLTGTCHIKG